MSEEHVKIVQLTKLTRESVSLKAEIDALTEERKRITKRIAEALTEHKIDRYELEGEAVSQWITKAGGTKFDREKAKAKLVDLGVQVTVIAAAFKAATTCGEPCRYVEVRALKGSKNGKG